MTAAVDLANSALNTLGATNITSLTEDTKTARIVNQRYPFVRDAVFRAHPWNCLITRVALTADSATPVFGYTKQYSLPNDPFCLRVLRLEEMDTVYRIEGRKLLINADTVKIAYVGRVLDVNQYDTLLMETIVARLAAEVCFNLTNSNTLTSQMNQLYEQKLSEARFVDATEGTPQNLVNQDYRTFNESDLFIASRF